MLNGAGQSENQNNNQLMDFMTTSHITVGNVLHFSNTKWFLVLNVWINEPRSSRSTTVLSLSSLSFLGLDGITAEENMSKTERTDAIVGEVCFLTKK